MLPWVEQTCVLLELRGQDGKADGLGSGGLVGPGLILTALHNVFDMQEPPDVVPGDVATPQVRALADLKEAFHATGVARNFDLSRVDLGQVVAHPLGQKHNTRLIWPAPGAPFPDKDIALLQIDGPVPANSALNLDPDSYDIGRLDTREDSLWGCGFPDISNERVGQSRLKYRPHRIVTGIRERESALLTYRSRLKVSAPNPRSASAWGGVSGTVLWVDAPDQRPRLVGVVNEAVKDAFSNDELFFTDLQKMIGAEGFETAFGRSLAPVEPVEEIALADVINLFKCDLDRVLSREEIREWMEFDVAPVEPCPAVFVIPVVGHSFDEPMLFVRTCLNLMDQCTNLPFDQHSETFSVTIAESAADLAYRRKVMMRSIGRRYSRSGRRGPPSEEDLAAAMADPTHPRVMVVEHTGAQVTADCQALVSTVLDIAAQMCDPQDPNVPFAPLVLFLTFVTGNSGENPEKPSVLPTDHDGKEPQIAKTLADLQRLHTNLAWAPDVSYLHYQRCDASHVTNWLDELRQARHSISTGFEDTLVRLLETQPTFPIRFADVAITEALKRAN